MIEVDHEQGKKIRELVAEEGLTPDEAVRRVLMGETEGFRSKYSYPTYALEGDPVADTPRRNKYGAIKQEEDGYTFDSKKELRRYRELKKLRDARDIHDLEVHPVFWFEHNGVKIGRFTPDFAYTERVSGERIVEDVKGGNATKTEAYRLRKKMLKAFHGIDVKEV